MGTQPVRSDELWWRKRWSGFRDTTRFQTTWKVTAMGTPWLSELTSSSSRRRGLSEAPQASSLPPHPAPGCHPSAQTATTRKGIQRVTCTHSPMHTHPTALELKIRKHWSPPSATLQDRIKSVNSLPGVQMLSRNDFSPWRTPGRKIIFLIVND